MKTLRITLAVGLSIIVCGCPARTGGPGNLRPGEIGHAESGILFPETVNGFARGEIRTYDSAEQDVSAGYDLGDAEDPIAITVYVYPAAKLISFGSDADFVESMRRTLADATFEDVKKAIIAGHPDAWLVSEEEAVLQLRGESLYGRSGKFKYRQRFGHQVEAAMSHVEVYSFGKWLIKFRVTHPFRSEEKAKGSMDGFKKAFCVANDESPNRSMQAAIE
jgi:hypothetical protein